MEDILMTFELWHWLALGGLVLFIVLPGLRYGAAALRYLIETRPRPRPAPVPAAPASRIDRILQMSAR